MRRNIRIKTLLLFLLFFTGAAWAEWRMVSETIDGIFYLDPATLRKEGDLRKIWLIEDHKTRQADGNMSNRLRSEYDCKNERSRVLANSAHSESMAKGTVIWNSSGKPSHWVDLPPGSAGEQILKTLCAQ